MRNILYVLMLCIPLTIGCEKEQKEMTPDFIKLTQNNWYIYSVYTTTGNPMEVDICEKGQYRDYLTNNSFDNVQEVQYCEEGHYSGSFQLEDRNLTIYIDGTEYPREVLELNDSTLVYKDKQLIYTYTTKR